MLWIYPSLALLLGGADPTFAPAEVALAPAPVVAPAPTAIAPKVVLGLEVLLTERLDLLKGKKVGLLTHPAAVDADWVPSIDRLVLAGKAGGFKVVQLSRGCRTLPTGIICAPSLAPSPQPATGQL